MTIEYCRGQGPLCKVKVCSRCGEEFCPQHPTICPDGRLHAGSAQEVIDRLERTSAAWEEIEKILKKHTATPDEGFVLLAGMLGEMAYGYRLPERTIEEQRIRCRDRVMDVFDKAFRLRVSMDRAKAEGN